MRLHPPSQRRPPAGRALTATLFLIACLATGPALAQQWDDIRWVSGPTTADLGEVARIEVPEGYMFSGAEGARTFLELFENPTNGTELGVIIPEITKNGVIDWFVIFEFNDIGYVEDDEEVDMYADEILDSIRQGTAEANKIRQQRGWGTIEVDGWERMPFYDPETNNLTWAITGTSAEGTSVNYSTRLLGRRGVINADLVIDPDQIYTAVPDYRKLLNGTSFRPGHRYEEFAPGDRVAAIGLAALVAGGAGALAVKTGLLARFWKLIVAGFAAAAAGLRKLFRGRGARQPSGA